MNLLSRLGPVRMRWLLALILLAAATAMTPAHAARAPFPYALSIQGGYGSAEVVVPVPAGSRPVALRGRITSSYSTPGDLLVTVNGRRAATVPALGGGRFAVDLRPRDVVDGGVTIGLRTDLRPVADCFADDQAVATMVNPVLRLNAAPPPPDTIAAFLAPGAKGFEVVVPADPNGAEQTAGLDAVLALRHLYPDNTAVTLTAGATPQDSTSRAVLVADTGDPENGLAVQAGQLLVTGTGDALAAAAVALADPNTGLLDVATVGGLTGTADYTPATGEVSLADLGFEGIMATGIGRVARTVTVTQAAFGAPVEQLIVDLTGSATPVLEGQQGRVNVLWNDQLVASRALTADSRVAVSFTIPAANLRNSNDLTVELQYQPAGGDCSNPPLPGKVDVDVATSTITPTFGSSAPPGFQRFPQSFPARIPVAAATPLERTLPQLADLLAAAAAASPLQYTVEIVAPTALSDGAVASGVTPEQATDLGAPLPTAFAAGDEKPYAALQAFQSGSEDLIVLSGEPAEGASILAAWPATVGWPTLTGQAYVSAGGQPQAYDTPSTAPDKRTPQLIAAGVLTAVLLLALLLWLWRRPRRA